MRTLYHGFTHVQKMNHQMPVMNRTKFQFNYRLIQVCSGRFRNEGENDRDGASHSPAHDFVIMLESI